MTSDISAITTGYDVAIAGIVVAGFVAIAVLALIGFVTYEGRERELIEARVDLMEERLKSAKEDGDLTGLLPPPHEE